MCALEYHIGKQAMKQVSHLIFKKQRQKRICSIRCEIYKFIALLFSDRWQANLKLS